MFLGRIFPLLWCMLLCLEATKGLLKMTEAKLQGHHIFFQQMVLESISMINEKKTAYYLFSSNDNIFLPLDNL